MPHATSASKSLRLFATFNAGDVVEFAQHPGPRLFQVLLWPAPRAEQLVDTLLQSSLCFTWDSVRNVDIDPDFSDTWNLDLPLERPWTPLNESTRDTLLMDMQDAGDSYSRSFRIVGQLPASDQTVPEITEQRLEQFLRTGSGVELIVYQCNDSPEFIYLNPNPAYATLQLIEREWDLLRTAKLIPSTSSMNYWAKRGRFLP